MCSQDTVFIPVSYTHLDVYKRQVYDKDWQNNRQRVEVSVLKKEKDSDRTLEGAIFGLFAKDDIKSETTGKVLIEADEIIELKSTDAVSYTHLDVYKRQVLQLMKQ